MPNDQGDIPLPLGEVLAFHAAWTEGRTEPTRLEGLLVLALRDALWCLERLPDTDGAHRAETVRDVCCALGIAEPLIKCIAPTT